jgi:hypothetical protein
MPIPAIIVIITQFATIAVSSYTQLVSESNETSILSNNTSTSISSEITNESGFQHLPIIGMGVVLLANFF